MRSYPNTQEKKKNGRNIESSSNFDCLGVLPKVASFLACYSVESYETHDEKTRFLHMRKQSRRSAMQ